MSVRGYRIWLPSAREGEIRSLASVMHTLRNAPPWGPGDNSAACYCTYREGNQRQTPAAQGHRCGFWAYATLHRALLKAEQIRSQAPIAGIIDGWGEISIHLDVEPQHHLWMDDGFRCAHARIIAFVDTIGSEPEAANYLIYSRAAGSLAQRQRLNRIAERFDVPILTMDEAARFAENRTVTMYEALRRWPEAFASRPLFSLPGRHWLAQGLTEVRVEAPPTPLDRFFRGVG